MLNIALARSVLKQSFVDAVEFRIMLLELAFGALARFSVAHRFVADPFLRRRRGGKRAMVALARRISVILHRMWVDDTDFRSESPVPLAT